MVGKFEQLLLLGLLFFIMLGMGASLTLKDFVLALKRPMGLFIGFVAQFGIMPLLAFTLAKALSLSPAHAIGLLIMGSMPGGTTSNLFTYFSKGNLALSMLMTVNSTVFAILMTPLALALYGGVLLADSELKIPQQNIIVSLALLLVPVAIGMAIRKWNANIGALVELAGGALGLFFIVFLLVTWVPRNWHLLASSPWQLFAGSIGLGVVGFLLGYSLAKALKLHPRNARTVSLETGIQNGPLAIGIVLLSFSGELQQQVVFIPALYSLFIVITATMLTLWFRRANEAAEQKIPDLL
jgi:BASS family bile acid:Na+ symporter